MIESCLMDRIRFFQIGLIIAFAGSVLLLVPQVFNSDSEKPLPLPSVLGTGDGKEHKQGFTYQYNKKRSPVTRAGTRNPGQKEQQSYSKLHQGFPKPNSDGTSGLMPSSQQKQQTMVNPPDVWSRQKKRQGILPPVSLHNTEQKTVCTETVTLPQPVTTKIKSYLYFIGHARSGHSIVGSILDSHPHIVVSHEFDVFGKLNQDSTSYNSKTRLFNALWKNSCTSITDGLRTDEADKKGYTLAIDNLYQGAYQSYIDVIGDKRGGLTSAMYMKDPDMFESTFRELKSIVNLPMKVIHVIRNPYDNIATSVMFEYKKLKHVKKITTLKESDHEQPINPKLVDKFIVNHFKIYKATEEIKVKYNLDVLEIHGKDLIANPKKVIMKMCDFLQVSCSGRFLTVCADKVFPEESKTRYKLKWSDDQILQVKKNIDKYKNLQRYLKFDS